MDLADETIVLITELAWRQDNGTLATYSFGAEL
jgi:hypothetical protein